MRLADMGLSLEAVRAAVTGATHETPKGHLDTDGRRLVLAANDQLFTADDFRDLTVTWKNGAPVRLGDVAAVTDSVLDDRQAGWFGTRPAVIILVYRQPDANVVATVDEVRAALPQLGRWMPRAVKLHVVFDRTTLIRASVADVQRTIWIAIALVAFVVALFVRRLWATVIPLVTIPLVLAGTLAVMALCGYSPDNLSLMALTIAVGFVVDDAVIVIEAATRRVEEGVPALEATLASARSLGGTILSVTAALVAALVPVLFMRDILGRYFREFGVTLVAALALSALATLTVTPTLCARLLGRGQARLEPRRGPGRLTAAYVRSLDWWLRHAGLGAAVSLALAGGTAALYVALPKGLMPTQDTGVMHVQTVASPSISFAEMEGLQRRVDDIVAADPAVDAVTAFTGSDVVSWGDLWVGLKSLNVRGAPVEAVVERLKGKLAKVDGLRAFINPVQDLNIGLGGGSARYQVRLTGTDPLGVLRAGEALRRALVKLPELTDVIGNADTRSGLSAELTVDRVQAARFGVTPTAVDNAVYDAFSQRQMALIYLPLSFSKVVLEVDPRYAADPAAFASLYVAGAGGASVPLSELTRLERAHEPMWVRHAAQFPTMAVSFNTRPGVAIGDAIGAIRAAQARLVLPDAIKVEFTGEAGAAGDSGAREGLLFLAGVVAVYVVLGVLYESLAHPFTILTTLPSAGFGALLALWLTRTEFTMLAAIAGILVVGMMMKNAILLVDVALAAERERGLPAALAIRQAALTRARPILMTVMVAALSALPLALGHGPGHELRQPLGIAVVGGLLVSQAVTLYAVPVVYVLMDRLRARLTRKAIRTVAA